MAVAGALLVLVSVGRIIYTDDFYLDSPVKDINDLAGSKLTIETARPNNSQHFYLGVSYEGSRTGFLASYGLEYVLTEYYDYSMGCNVLRYKQLEYDQKIVNGAPYPSFIDRSNQIFTFREVGNGVFYIQSANTGNVFTVYGYKAGSAVTLRPKSRYLYGQRFTTQNKIP